MTKQPSHHIHVKDGYIGCNLDWAALQIVKNDVTKRFNQTYWWPGRASSNCMNIKLPDNARQKFEKTGGYISEDAVISKGAKIDPTAVIGPGVIVEAGVEIGAYCVIGANTYLGPEMKLKRNVVILEGAHLNFQGTVFESAFISDQVIMINDEKAPGAGLENNTRPRGSIGPGAVVDNRSVLIGAITLGDGVYLGRSVMIAGLTRIGAFSSVGEYCKLESTEVGKNVSIDDNVSTEALVRVADDCKIIRVYQGTNIKTGAVLGEGVVVESVKEIGSGVKIGQGACLCDIGLCGRDVVVFPKVTVKRSRFIPAKTVIDKSINCELTPAGFLDDRHRRKTINKIFAQNEGRS